MLAATATHRRSQPTVVLSSVELRGRSGTAMVARRRRIAIFAACATAMVRLALGRRAGRDVVPSRRASTGDNGCQPPCPPHRRWERRALLYRRSEYSPYLNERSRPRAALTVCSQPGFDTAAQYQACALLATEESAR